ncbi:MAG: cyclase family protein [Candidatus Bathyarchaeia archaeon]
MKAKSIPGVKRIIDLTHPLYHQCPSWPGLPQPEIKRIKTLPYDGATIHLLTMHTHTATHMDAPAHFIDGAKTLEEIPLDVLIGEAALVNIQGKKPKDFITPQDLAPNMHIREGDFVVLNTGWHKKRGINREYQLWWPSLNREAAEWLARRKIRGLGTDGASIDQLGGQDYPAHEVILGNGIFVVEELANLDQISQKRFIICVLPLNIPGVDGSPARVIALEF